MATKVTEAAFYIIPVTDVDDPLSGKLDYLQVTRRPYFMQTLNIYLIFVKEDLSIIAMCVKTMMVINQDLCTSRYDGQWISYMYITRYVFGLLDDLP